MSGNVWSICSINKLSVKKSDPLQLVCKPEERQALLVVSTQRGASKAAHGERERLRDIKRHNDNDSQGEMSQRRMNTNCLICQTLFNSNRESSPLFVWGLRLSVQHKHTSAPPSLFVCVCNSSNSSLNAGLKL